MSNTVSIAIVAILIIVIAGFFAARRLWPKERFSLETPAAPRAREAAADLFAALKAIVATGRQFAVAVEGRPQYAAAAQGVAHITGTLGRAEQLLVGSPPTYVNYLAIYRGLADSDGQLLRASDAYIKAGREIQQNVYRGTLGGSAPSGEEASVGNALTDMGRQLRRVVGAVHRLGVALDVE